jgi:hypothetical protein
MLSNGSKYKPLIDWLAASRSGKREKEILRQDNKYGRYEQLGSNML